MYLTTQLFVQKSLDAGMSAKDLLTLLEVTMSLLRRYGQKIDLPELQKAVQEAAPEVGKFLTILDTHDLLEIKDVQEMQRITLQITDTKQHKFTAVGPKAEQAAQVLQDKYDDATVTTKETENPELYVAGDGLYYKRSLTTDLDKLLR